MEKSEAHEIALAIENIKEDGDVANAANFLLVIADTLYAGGSPEEVIAAVKEAAIDVLETANSDFEDEGENLTVIPSTNEEVLAKITELLTEVIVFLNNP